MPYGITQCYLPPGRGDIPALVSSLGHPFDKVEGELMFFVPIEYVGQKFKTKSICVYSATYSSLGRCSKARGALTTAPYKSYPFNHTRLTALFRDYPGEPVPERKNQSGFY